MNDLKNPLDTLGDSVKKAGASTDSINSSLKKALEPFEGTLAKVQGLLDSSFGLSVNSAQALKNNMDEAKKLTDMIAKLQRPMYVDLAGTSSVYDAPNFHMPKNPILETNERLEELVQYAEDMKPVVAQSVTLIESMNTASMQLLGEFAKNAKETKIQAYVAIGLAVVSLILGTTFSWLSYKESTTSSVQFSKMTESIVKVAEDINIDNAKRTHLLIGEFKDALKATADAQSESFERALKRIEGVKSEEKTR